MFCRANYAIHVYVNNTNIHPVYIIVVLIILITVCRYVVCITVETFITICYPTKIKQMCTVFRARVVTIVLLLTALVIYLVAPFTNKVIVAVIFFTYIVWSSFGHSRLHLQSFYIGRLILLLSDFIAILVSFSIQFFSSIRFFLFDNC